MTTAKLSILFSFAVLVATQAAGRPPLHWVDSVTVTFDGRHGQVEVGGPFVGLEFHASRPLPSRISFYSPVANSIDLSTDYWKRGESRPLVMGIRVDRGAKTWLGKEPWEYTLSPHAVSFHHADGDLRFTLAYAFCSDDPASVMSLTVRNAGTRNHDVELYTHLAIVLRSCQTYGRFATARTQYDRGIVLASFDDVPVGRARVAVQNGGIAPVGWTTSAARLGVADTGWSNWIRMDGLLDARASPTTGVRPVAAFLYRFRLPPGDSADIVQIISSLREGEVAQSTRRLKSTWRAEVARHDSSVRAAAGRGLFASGDRWMDRAVSYSKALLAANRHYLDGAIVPMPCPAEYNFMFTHDILLTNLSAISYDPERVKRDLLYLRQHARENVLPHAYYWKDDRFITEYCAPGNWNHLWFVLAAAAYLRHTLDTATVASLLPVMAHGLELTLERKEGDVMVGDEPDWWDFGKARGARAYLTILTIRALEEYAYVGSMLRASPLPLAECERHAAELRVGLHRELWDESIGYLLNRTGGLRDRHIYMGPLLAAVYQMLPDVQAQRLVATAGRELLDPPIGIRTVAPADFHTDSVRAFYEVKANEAGGPYFYANGGVWYLGNAWYAWALRSIGMTDSAYAFFRGAMTVDGIAESPRGQPALYEYRYADQASPDHGLVDKPTMMWSAGFCTGTAYRMLGLEDQAWNLSVGGAVPATLDTLECDYMYGRMKRFTRTGRGTLIASVTCNGREMPSRVLPLDAAAGASVSVEHGPVRFPYLDRVNALLWSASLDTARRTLSILLSSFEGHTTSVRVVTPWAAQGATLNGVPVPLSGIESPRTGAGAAAVEYAATAFIDTLTMRFATP